MSSGTTCVVLGVPIDDVTLAEAVDRITEMVEHGRATGVTHQVATINVDFVVNALADETLLRTLQRSDLAVPDGMPLVWASGLIGSPLRERTTGIDLLPALAERAAREGHRIVLFGGAPGVADDAVDVLRSGNPALAVEAVPAPTVAPDGTMEPGVDDALRERRADIVCVALGNPKQEHWIARHREAVGAPVYIGVGGSLDFLTGTTTRAPAWMRRSGLEWVHRAMSEPRRLVGRYANDLRVFGPAIARQAWRGRRRGEAVAPSVRVDGDELVVTVTGPPPAARPEPVLSAHLRSGGHITVDRAGSGPMDNASASWLVGLAREARRNGGHVDVTTNAGNDRAWAAVGGRGALVDLSRRQSGHSQE